MFFFLRRTVFSEFSTTNIVQNRISKITRASQSEKFREATIFRAMSLSPLLLYRVSVQGFTSFPPFLFILPRGYRRTVETEDPQDRSHLIEELPQPIAI